MTAEARRATPPGVLVDDDSAVVTERAVEALSLCRSPFGLGAGTLRTHALASLIAQAQALLPGAVADALDQGYTWAEVAAQLGMAPGTARGRYGRYHRERMPIDLD